MGTRVRPLSYTYPKPMIPIVEKPIISYLFSLLKRHNCNEVVMAVSYKADVVKAHYQNGAEFGMHIAYSLEGKMEHGQIIPEQLGSAGGLKKVQNFAQYFDEPFLVLCGDALIDLDLTAAMEYHKSHGGLATVVCQKVPKEEVYRYGVVVIDENMMIRSFQEKPKVSEAKSDIINTGIYIFDPKVLDLVPEHREFDIGGDLLPLLAERGLPFYAYTPDFHWVDVGTISDFYRANMMLLSCKIKDVKPYGVEVKPDVWVGINSHIDWDNVEIVPPVYIGNSVRIEKGVRIVGPAVIESGSVIQEKAHIEKSVVFNYTKVSRNLQIKERIITSKYLITPEGCYLELEKLGLNFLIDDSRKKNHHLVGDQVELIESLPLLYSEPGKPQ